MLYPFMFAGMVQRHKFASERINCLRAYKFTVIAALTSVCQIVRGICSIFDQRHDMLDRE